MPYVFYDKPCVFFGTPKRLPEVGDLLPEEVKLVLFNLCELASINLLFL